MSEKRPKARARGLRRQKSWIGSCNCVCRSSTSTAARFSTETWSRRTFSWRSTTRSSWATSAYPRSSNQPTCASKQSRERRTTCRPRFAKTSLTRTSPMCGPSAASCTSCACWSMPSTPKTCWVSCSRSSKTNKSPFQTHTARASKTSSVYFWPKTRIRGLASSTSWDCHT